MPDTTRTNELNVIVETYQRGRVVFRDLITGERWAELGECNQCGLCIDPKDPTVEWIDGVRVGEPGACRDLTYETRPLVVTRPSWEPKVKILAKELGVTGCSLTFEVLE